MFRPAILDVWFDSEWRILPMTTKRVAIFAVAFATGCSIGASAFAANRHHHQAQPERYVPANGDIIDILFGGPRYYDNHLFTTAAEPCSYNRVGPDANAANVINDHYCGK
ncbi:hypothetical protein [Mesorhizobium sp. M1329]|uniref:hypothetical protein n=1 Tax=unclassified Mesorhizobium TaxID=325217 RepID=UPI00333D759A